MSKLIRFEVVPFQASRVIGKQVIHTVKSGAPNPVPRLWEGMAADGSLDELKRLPERSTVGSDTVGWMGEYNPVTQEFVYLAGVLAEPGAPVPEGYTFRDIPDCTMSIGYIEGTEEEGDLYTGASELAARARHQHGYEYDHTAGDFEMEYYSYERFTVPLERGEKRLVLDYYSPCRPIGSKAVSGS